MTDFTPKISLTQAMTSPNLFAHVFAAPSFWPWRTVAKLIDGIPLTEPREIELYQQCTGRQQLPHRHEQRLLRRFIVLAGRRAGKDRFFSGVAVWRCVSVDWRRHQSPGEQSVVILLGRDRKQAAILRRYCHGLLEVEALQREIVRQTSDVVEFRNGSQLEIASNDASLVRGRSAIAVIGSECSFWKSEHSVNADEEVVGAAEPSMAMCPDGGLLLLGSTVHRQRGLMYRFYKELFGNEQTNDVCWFAPSRTMNPLLRQSVVDAALASDPYRGAAEFNNRWREDLTDCFPLDAIEQCTDYNVFERPPQPHTSYKAYFDSATGTGSDAFTLAIGHRLLDAVGTVMVDVVRERKPRFVPSDVIKEYSLLLKLYGIHEIHGDAFAGGYQDEWLRNGIRFIAAEFSTSENYLRSLPMVLSQRARFVNSATLRSQLAGLERSVAGGHEKVDHPRHANAHDDVSASVCGLLVVAGNRLAFDLQTMLRDGEPPAATAEQQQRSYAARNFQSYLFRCMGFNPAQPSRPWGQQPWD
jgi:hypothetical protein